METTVIAGVSHKGGTGRSVTLANLAHQLHHRGPADVCLVDLDLASPTMGSVLEIEGLERGQAQAGRQGDPRSVHDLLINYDDPESALVDLRNSSASIRKHHRSEKRFALVPGQANGGDWAQKLSALRPALRNLLENLRSSRFDYVILDIRSGLSDVLEALRADSADLIDLLLIHFRWTPQHIMGLEGMLQSDRIQGFGEDRIRLVRTAYCDPDAEPLSIRSKVSDIDGKIRQKFSEIVWFNKELDINKSPVIATVPLDPLLRWKECVITPDEAEGSPSFPVFKEMAAKIADQTKG